MEEYLVHFIYELKSLDWHAILSLGILGIILIIANAITHYNKERITARMRAAHHAKEIIDQSSEPMKRRADDLIARLSTLLIGWANVDDMREVKQMVGAGDYDERLATISPERLKWVEVVAFRILEFQWSVHRFRTMTQSLINDPRVEELEYFVVDKLPFALRGRVYSATFFSREEEEEMAHFFSPDLNAVEGPTLKELTLALKEPDHRRLFKKLVEFLSFDRAEIFAVSDDPHAPDTKRHCAITHFTIYLIDFFQKLAHSSKWEEHRVVFVRTLMRLNEARDIKLYLYYPSDLIRRSYFFSYPEDVLECNALTKLLTRWHGNPFSPVRAIGFRWCVNRRAKRFIHRHHLKRIYKHGVRLVTKDRTYELSLGKGLLDLRSELVHYFESSGRRMPSLK